MPRPKKPKLPSFKVAKPVEISPETEKLLSKCLGITDRKLCNEMITFIEGILTTHISMEKNRDSVPTPASMIASIRHLQKSVLSLLKEFTSLDPFASEQLYLYTFQPGGSINPTDQYSSDRETLTKVLGRLVNRAAYSIGALEQSRKKGRPINATLHNTILFLGLAFSHYASDKNKFRKNLKEFIILALDAADISHPDPEKTPLLPKIQKRD